jgi:hypothetical protein
MKSGLLRPVLVVVTVVIFSSVYFAVEYAKISAVEKSLEKSLQAQNIENSSKIESIGVLICNMQLGGLKQRWNNILGVRYDSETNACIVKYSISEGKEEESPIDQMTDTKKN